MKKTNEQEMDRENKMRRFSPIIRNLEVRYCENVLKKQIYFKVRITNNYALDTVTIYRDAKMLLHFD